MPIASKISAYNRRRKWEIFLRELRPSASAEILDIGFSDREYSAVDNFLEKNYQQPEKITAIGIDRPDEFRRRYPLVKARQYDGRRIPFGDKQFDIGWSNAVIEHVGGRQRQVEFLKELKRVGRRCFVTTPNRWFPVEIHSRVPLLHYLPKNIFDLFLRLIGKKWATGDYLNLLSYRRLKKILAAADISDYRIIKNKLLGFTLDFIIIF
jgi:SAM-dependent methyltransferase